MIGRMPSLAPKCHVLYNPITLPKRAAPTKSGKNMAYLGGPSLLKGYGILRAALKHTRTRVVVHATGFTNQADELVGGSRIVFHERLHGQQYEQLYSEISTVIFPSVLAEPMSYVLVEAAIRSKLIIASDMGGTPELMSGCPGVFLFRPGDDDQLAALIDHVNGLDRRTIMKLGRKNGEIVLKKLDNNKNLIEFRHLLEKAQTT